MLLSDLVVRCARRLGDAVMLEATLTSSAVTFLDEVSVDHQRRHYAGTQIFFYDDPDHENYGQYRFVGPTAPSANTLQWAGALPATPLVGDKACLINARGKGWEVDEYRNAINDAIGRLRGVVLIHVEAAESGADVSPSAPTFEAPEELNELYRVEWYNPRYMEWHEVPKLRNRSGAGWSVDTAGSGTVRISGPILSTIGGASLRCFGYQYQPELEEWDDELSIDSTPVIEYTVLALTKLAVDRENRNPVLFVPNEKDANAALNRYRTMRRAGTEVIRSA